MTLLSSHRRRLGLMVAGLFGLLLISNIIPDPLARWQFRTPIPLDWSFGQRASLMFRNLGGFIQDNTGFRASLPVLRRSVRAALGSPDSWPIYAGRDGQLFWGHESTPFQSAGALLRTEKVARYVSMLGEMQRALAPEGTRVVVAIPPNAQSVEKEALPVWTDALNYPTTEYDLALQGLKAEGVTTVDLRPVLRATPRPRYLITDTHWNLRSSVLSFNAVMAAAGHPDWQVDPAKVVGPLEPAPRGDLLRTMRMPTDLKEQNFRFIVPPGIPQPRPDPALAHPNPHPGFKSQVWDYGRKGPRVLIMGDSFTVGLWPQLFAGADVSAVGWMHASRRTTGNCDFDFGDVRAFRPDLLIVVRTERFIPCAAGDWPVGLPQPLASAVPRNAVP